MIQREDFLRKIESNISQHGYHVTIVTGSELPRFAYTIGCKETLGSEFVFAGGENYSQFDISEIFNETASTAKKESDWHNLSVSIASLGSFSVVQADKSWSKLLTLGVFDYYNQTEIQVWQILPDANHRTLDVPDMSKNFEVSAQPIWQWLSRKWNYPVPSGSMAVTNLAVLFGERAIEATRWEKDGWEIFSGAGPDTPKEEMRIVPLGLLIGIDKSLEPVVHLEIGKGLWRDSDGLEWNNWE
ncbi:DUF4262 domain-containing protein [Hymenobacter convexus]|uniref:DUF4262 domain-containing protein n=1 Tax=Hymenobacter sp. CA1UV-4 TaxID=3063782 RepID=UPI0027123A09|nr:DUF4262 domain-containing protein [Hymenobacter sp. CA1UV-4]MDO7853287.1 DUF4262 domain-containing protein [Hymenobacter sp. CA1UV-4]